MKTSLLSILLLGVSIASFAEEGDKEKMPTIPIETTNFVNNSAFASRKQKEKTAELKKENNLKIKKGWGFAPCPAFSYNSDTGLQLGALCDVYYYGDGRAHPGYMQKMYFDISWFTKGAVQFHVDYDSSHLIPGVRFTASATYKQSPMYQFFGFNGFSSTYEREWDSKGNTAMYNVNRDLARVFTLFQGKITGNLKWAAGISYSYYRFRDINIKGKDGNLKYIPEKTLYNKYIKTGIIEEGEKNGGHHIELKAGVVYDSRDNEPSPNSGICAEAYMFGSPKIKGLSDYDYYKIALHFKHYISAIKNRLVFAYHLGYQGSFAGNAPFYIQQNISSLFVNQADREGLGGRATVRGVQLNRIVGNGFLWANFELRARIVDFRFIGQEWRLSINPFLDMGGVVQPYRLKKMEALTKLTDAQAAALGLEKGYKDIYTGKRENIHFGAGLGLKLAVNHNFIIAAEVAKPFNKQDGNQGIYIGLNYIF